MFNIGDRVQVIDVSSGFYAEKGEVTAISSSYLSVKIDNSIFKIFRQDSIMHEFPPVEVDTACDGAPPGGAAEHAKVMNNNFLLLTCVEIVRAVETLGFNWSKNGTENRRSHRYPVPASRARAGRGRTGRLGAASHRASVWPWAGQFGLHGLQPAGTQFHHGLGHRARNVARRPANQQ